MGDRTNMNEFELDKEYPNLQFKSDKDAMKMSVLYFIELVRWIRRGGNIWIGSYWASLTIERTSSTTTKVS